MLHRIPGLLLDAAPEPARRLRFMEVVRRRLREARLSPRTQRAYDAWIRRFIWYNDRVHPRFLGGEQVRAYLTSLAVVQSLSHATQAQARAALGCLYGRVLRQPFGTLEGVVEAARPAAPPVIASDAAVHRILPRLQPAARLCAEFMYGGGLRVGECVRLRIRDVDFDRHALRVPGRPGGVAVAVAPAFRAHLVAQVVRARQMFRTDAVRGVRPAGLSPTLLRRYPSAFREERWAFLFPASRLGDRRERRHLHETAVQRAIRLAALRAGIEPRITGQSLRFAFAAGLFASGADALRIQRLLGHRDFRTTLAYRRRVEQ